MPSVVVGVAFKEGDTGKMILFVRSILWDLDIPQEAATILYEDNDACTVMGNAQKPTPRTRHIDIGFSVGRYEFIVWTMNS